MSVNIFQNNALKKIAGNYAIDSSLSTTSDNAVQNKVITSAINDINSKVGTGTLDVGSDCVSGINTLNTHLSDKIGVESVKTIVPSTDNTNAYFNYPSGYSQIDFVVLSIEAFNGVKLNVNPTWAQVDLYPDNGVVLCGTIPSEYKGKDLYIQYALIE